MTQSSDPKAAQAYTRASVEAYLRAAADECARIESAITEAHERTAWAQAEEQRLKALGRESSIADRQGVATVAAERGTAASGTQRDSGIGLGTPAVPSSDSQAPIP
jgi:hypothetical protein